MNKESTVVVVAMVNNGAHGSCGCDGGGGEW